MDIAVPLAFITLWICPFLFVSTLWNCYPKFCFHFMLYNMVLNLFGYNNFTYRKNCETSLAPKFFVWIFFVLLKYLLLLQGQACNDDICFVGLWCNDYYMDMWYNIRIRIWYSSYRITFSLYSLVGVMEIKF